MDGCQQIPNQSLQHTGDCDDKVGGVRCRRDTTSDTRGGGVVSDADGEQRGAPHHVLVSSHEVGWEGNSGRLVIVWRKLCSLICFHLCFHQLLKHGYISITVTSSHSYVLADTLLTDTCTHCLHSLTAVMDIV